MKDPYEVLGVPRGASADELKQAYHSLARELHPDVNPGNRRAEERFKEISAAYDFLADKVRRGQYDRGEIDPTGVPRRRARGHGAGPRGRDSAFNFGENADDILAELLRRRDKGRAGGAGRPPRRGEDAHHPLSVTFSEAAAGTTKRVALVTGKSLDVRIPAGAADGQSLRLKGQGHPGGGGGPDGDAFVDIQVEPHPYFRRRDLDVLLDLPVSLQEAVHGAKVTVPTIDGKVSLSIPAGANSGTVLRLKGRGIAGSAGRGDQLVTVSVVLPENDKEFNAFVDKWGPKHPYDPRAKMEG